MWYFDTTTRASYQMTLIAVMIVLQVKNWDSKQPENKDMTVAIALFSVTAEAY